MPGVLLVVQVGWIVGLAVVGLRYLRVAPRGGVVGARPETQEEPTRARGSSSPYLRGVLLALPNLVSPTFVPSLIFLMGVVQARGWVGHEVGEHILYAVGFGTGTALWFVLLLRTLTPLRARLSPQVLPLLSRVAGGALLLCAIVLTSHIVTATPWSRLPGGSRASAPACRRGRGLLVCLGLRHLPDIYARDNAGGGLGIGG